MGINLREDEMRKDKIKEIIMSYEIEGKTVDLDEDTGASYESEIYEKVKVTFSKKMLEGRLMSELIDLAINKNEDDIESFKQLLLKDYYESGLNYDDEMSDMAIKLNFETIYVEPTDA